MRCENVIIRFLGWITMSKKRLFEKGNTGGEGSL